MLQRSCGLFVIVAAVCTTAAAVSDESTGRPSEVPGWGRAFDPRGDCDVTLVVENDRLKIEVPGTPHVLSVEATERPMDASRVVRRVRGDFTASVRVLGRLAPGRRGRRLGETVNPSSGIGGNRSGAGGIPVMPGAGQVSDPWPRPGFGSPVIIRPQPRLTEARPV